MGVKVPPMIWLGLGVGAVLVVGAVFAGRKVAATVEAAVPKLTPASPENLVYKDIIGGTGRVLSQDENWTLGGWVADIRDRVTGTDAKIRQMLEGAAPLARSPGAAYSELYL